MNPLKPLTHHNYAHRSRTPSKVYRTNLWTAYITPAYIRVGCQRHSIRKWKTFTSQQISAMHNYALEYWLQHKTAILTIAANLTSTKQNQPT